MTTEKKHMETEIKLCFMEKLKRTIYDVAAKKTLRFPKLKHLATSFVEQDWSEYLRLARQLDIPDKYVIIGDKCEMEDIGTHSGTMRKKYELYKKGSDLGSCCAMGKLAVLYLSRRTNLTGNSNNLLKKATKMGCGYAAAVLCMDYKSTNFGSKNVNKTKFIEYGIKSVKMGCGCALTILARRLKTYESLPGNCKNLTEVYEMGMEMGDNHSARMLGWLNTLSHINTFKYYQLSAHMGNIAALKDIKDALDEMKYIPNQILDILSGNKDLPIKYGMMVLNRRQQLNEKKIADQEQAIKALQLKNSIAGKKLGHNLCNKISSYI